MIRGFLLVVVICVHMSLSKYYDDKSYGIISIFLSYTIMRITWILLDIAFSY